MRHALAAILLLIFVVPASAASSVVDSRADRLRHGVNLSHWFAQNPDPAGYTKAHLETWFTEKDAALIKKMGFDHVRFTLEPAPFFEVGPNGALPAEYLGYVDAAIDMLLRNGLAVIVDIHPTDEFKKRLGTDDKHVEAFAAFWRAFAAHLTKYDPDRVFLEVLNEPEVEDAYRWAGIQAHLVRAIREAAPRHTIIVTGPNWSNPDDLLKTELVADPNVIYNFHFYTPHTFTHQGASWGSPTWKFLTRVPYPSSPDAVAPYLSAVTDEGARRELQQYGDERWDAARIDSVIAKMADWAKARGVRLTCNEFGAYRKNTKPDERAAWLRDVRSSLERHGIGWTMWDYAGGFSVVNREKGGPATPDEPTLRALGL